MRGTVDDRFEVQDRCMDGIAVGLQGRFNARSTFSIGAAHDGDDSSVGAGVAMRLS